jgi:hypothetical protein
MTVILYLYIGSDTPITVWSLKYSSFVFYLPEDGHMGSQNM